MTLKCIATSEPAICRHISPFFAHFSIKRHSVTAFSLKALDSPFPAEGLTLPWVPSLSFAGLLFPTCLALVIHFFPFSFSGLARYVIDGILILSFFRAPARSNARSSPRIRLARLLTPTLEQASEPKSFRSRQEKGQKNTHKSSYHNKTEKRGMKSSTT